MRFHSIALFLCFLCSCFGIVTTSVSLFGPEGRCITNYNGKFIPYSLWLFLDGVLLMIVGAGAMLSDDPERFVCCGVLSLMVSMYVVGMIAFFTQIYNVCEADSFTYGFGWVVFLLQGIGEVAAVSMFMWWCVKKPRLSPAN
jgi:hypothetical protein